MSERFIYSATPFFDLAGKRNVVTFVRDESKIYGEVISSRTDSDASTSRFSMSSNDDLWGPWSPWTPVDVCVGQEFQQERYRINLSGKFPPQFQYRVAVGTLPPNYVYDGWTPSEDTVCEGESFTQERLVTDTRGCVPNFVESRSATGTKECGCTYGDWLPPEHHVCAGVTFTQYKYLDEGQSEADCPNPIEREAVGTCQPVWSNWTEWEPLESNVCEGVTFTQTRSRTDTSDCWCEPEWEERQATGTEVCPTDTECCDSSSGCTLYCPGPGCTPDDGVCCDGNCITCGDCGEGGEQCCNSTEIKSLFDDLSHESEMLKWGTLVTELEGAWGADKVEALVEVALKFGIKKDEYWKVSVLARAYMIDCMDEVAKGADVETSYAKHHAEWAKFVSLTRGRSAV